MAAAGAPRTAGGAAAAARLAAELAAAEEEGIRPTPCVLGFPFIKSTPGLLNIASLVALLCVLIATGMSSAGEAQKADFVYFLSNVQVSAYHTRNACIVFAVFGLLLMAVDTLLYVRRWVLRLPAGWDMTCIVLMIIFSIVFLILGCCAAAWEAKVQATVGKYFPLEKKGAAAAAAAFLFIASFAMVADAITRLVNPHRTAAK